MTELAVGIALLVLGLLAGLAKRDHQYFTRIALWALAIFGCFGAVSVIWSVALSTAQAALLPFVVPAKRAAAKAALSAYGIDDRINLVMLTIDLALAAIYFLSDKSSDK